MPTTTALKRLLAFVSSPPLVSVDFPAYTIANRTARWAYGTRDPYAMAWAAIDGAFRSLVAIGVQPSLIVLLATFDWQEPLGALVRCLQACHDASVALQAPILNSRQLASGHNSVRFSAIGLSPTTRINDRLTRAGNRLYVVGNTQAEMGGTHYALMHKEEGGIVPQGLTEGLMRYRSVYRAIRDGLVTSCRPILAGGLGVALSQLAAGTDLGLHVELNKVPGNIAHDDLLLFSESIGRFLVEVAPEHEQQFNFQLTAEPHAQIGKVIGEPQLMVSGYDGDLIVDVPFSELDA